MSELGNRRHNKPSANAPGDGCQRQAEDPMSELGSRWPNKPSTEHIGRRLSAADKEPRSNMTLPMQVKTICLNKESREEIPTRTHDKKRRIQQESQAPSSATSRAIGPHSMTIGAPRRAPPHNFPERAIISER